MWVLLVLPCCAGSNRNLVDVQELRDVVPKDVADLAKGAVQTRRQRVHARCSGKCHQREDQ